MKSRLAIAFFLHMLVRYSIQQFTSADEDCVGPENKRCADGLCRQSCESQLMAFPAFCSKFSSNYQCGKGYCASSYSDCLAKQNISLANRTECANSNSYFELTQPQALQRRILQSKLQRILIL